MAKREKEETELEVPAGFPSASAVAEAAQCSGRDPPKFEPIQAAEPSEEGKGGRLEGTPPAEAEERVMRKARGVNRCGGCGRRVGLTGFRCQCGELFCGEHRYSDRHACCYDYKAAGRAAIARENPVVRPAKIVRI